MNPKELKKPWKPFWITKKIEKDKLELKTLNTIYIKLSKKNITKNFPEKSKKTGWSQGISCFRWPRSSSGERLHPVRWWLRPGACWTPHRCSKFQTDWSTMYSINKWHLLALFIHLMCLFLKYLLTLKFIRMNESLSNNVVSNMNSKALFTQDILTHNIAIKDIFDFYWPT